jgi:hypothetical protein
MQLKRKTFLGKLKELVRHPDELRKLSGMPQWRTGKVQSSRPQLLNLVFLINPFQTPGRETVVQLTRSLLIVTLGRH